MEQPSFSYEKFSSLISVSRGTYEKLSIYHEALLKWQKTVNLISQKTVHDAWTRHFLDSAQTFRLIKNPNHTIFDLGSGAGFPGLILSIMGASNVHLIESDQRKCSFLQEIKRLTSSDVTVHNCRIEELKVNFKADLVTSRACAGISELLRLSEPLLQTGGACLFLKGKNASDELSAASLAWNFGVEGHQSITDSEGVILSLSSISPKPL